MTVLRNALPFIIPVIAAGFFACTGNGPSAGGGSNTGNANILAGIIRNSDGTAPAQCSASLYRSDAVPVRSGEKDTNIVATTSTDTGGRFAFSGIADGAYNIYCIDSAGFHSTLIPEKSVSGNDSLFIGEDTLHFVGSLAARVENPGPGATFAFIYGSPILSEVNDSSGFVLLNGLPVGNDLSITFMTEERTGSLKCQEQYRYKTLPDTTLFITVTLKCEQAGR